MHGLHCYTATAAQNQLQNRTLATQCASWSSFTTTILYVFKASSFLVGCTDDLTLLRQYIATAVLNISCSYFWLRGDRGSKVVKVLCSIPAGVNGFFIDIKSFWSHYGPGVDSSSNRNEYQQYFLGVKSGRCVRLTTLPPSCAVVTKSGNLNFLRTLWACPGL